MSLYCVHQRLVLGRYSHAVMVGVSKVLSTIEIWIMTAEH